MNTPISDRHPDAHNKHVEQTIDSVNIALPKLQQMYDQIILIAFHPNAPGKADVCTVAVEPNSSFSGFNTKVRRLNVLDWDEVYPESDFASLYQGVTRNGFRFRFYTFDELDRIPFDGFTN